MTRTTRELIGRGAMVLLALLLLAGAFGLGRSAAWLSHEEREEELRNPTRAGSFHRKTRIAPVAWIATGVVGMVGGVLLVVAVLPNRVIYRIRHKAPVLWENPEPGQMNRF